MSLSLGRNETAAESFTRILLMEVVRREKIVRLDGWRMKYWMGR